MNAEPSRGGVYVPVVGEKAVSGNEAARSGQHDRPHGVSTSSAVSGMVEVSEGSDGFGGVSVDA